MSQSDSEDKLEKLNLELENELEDHSNNELIENKNDQEGEEGDENKDSEDEEDDVEDSEDEEDEFEEASIEDMLELYLMLKEKNQRRRQDAGPSKYQDEMDRIAHALMDKIHGGEQELAEPELVTSHPIYHISGHLDLSKLEWERHYTPKLDRAIDQGACFVVGEARGTDRLALDYLWDKGLRGSRVIVFHMLEQPRYNPGYPTCGGFKNDEQRDFAMTRHSTADLAWVRSEEETKKLYGKKYRPGRISGTQRNLERREKFRNFTIRDIS